MHFEDAFKNLLEKVNCLTKIKSAIKSPNKDAVEEANLKLVKVVEEIEDALEDAASALQDESFASAGYQIVTTRLGDTDDNEIDETSTSHRLTVGAPKIHESVVTIGRTKARSAELNEAIKTPGLLKSPKRYMKIAGKASKTVFARKTAGAGFSKARLATQAKAANKSGITVDPKKILDENPLDPNNSTQAKAANKAVPAEQLAKEAAGKNLNENPANPSNSTQAKAANKAVPIERLMEVKKKAKDKAICESEKFKSLRVFEGTIAKDASGLYTSPLTRAASREAVKMINESIDLKKVKVTKIEEGEEVILFTEDLEPQSAA